jgi:glycosyltransferase involved in cell wall biosynthesis
MIKDKITALIVTFNEAPNLRRTLEQLTWVGEILVLDSGSTDETLHIAKQAPNVRILHREFDTFAQQCNFGLAQITTEWVLSLDADYVLTDEINDEIGTLEPTDQVSGFTAHFSYCIHGRPLRASLYPPRTVLYRRAKARYRDEGHGHRVDIDGNISKLKEAILHDDRKPLSRWLGEQVKYARKEAEYLTTTPDRELKAADRVRQQAVLAPFLVFLHTLLVRGLILDGRAGWFYVFQRVLAEVMLSLHLLEKGIKDKE